MAKIIITISKTGQVETEVQGVKGSGCSAISAAFAQAIGITTEDTTTGEYYEPEEDQYETQYG